MKDHEHRFSRMSTRSESSSAISASGPVSSLSNRSSIFLTEVDSRPVSSQSFVYAPLSEPLDPAKPQTVLNCSYPVDFDGDDPPPFPRVPQLTPSFILKKTVNRYFPEVNTQRNETQRKQTLQFQSIYQSRVAQDFVLDTFWWLFIQLFGDLYLRSRAKTIYGIQRDESDSLHWNELSIRSNSSRSLSSLMNSTIKELHPKVGRWIDSNKKRLCNDQRKIFSRLARNYSEITVNILGVYRSKIEHSRKTRNAKSTVRHEIFFPSIMSFAAALSFSHCFPESTALIETDDFRSKVSQHVMSWFYGDNYSFLVKNILSDDITMTPRDCETREDLLKPVVDAMVFIHGTKNEVDQSSVSIEVEEQLRRLQDRIEEMDKGAFGSLKYQLESHKQESIQKFKDWREEYKIECQRRVGNGQMTIHEYSELFGMDQEQDDEYDDDYRNDEELENEMDRHRKLFAFRGDYSMLTSHSRKENLSYVSPTLKIFSNQSSNLTRVHLSSCLSQSPLMTRYISDLRMESVSSKRKSTRKPNLPVPISVSASNDFKSEPVNF